MAGLAANPKDRPESVEPILAALSAALTRRRRLAIAGAVVAAVGVAGGYALAREGPACERPADDLDAALSAAGIAAIERTLADGGPDGHLAWSRTRPRLDTVASALDRAWLEACEAGRAGDRPDEATTRQRQCLLDARHTLAIGLGFVADGDLSALGGLTGAEAAVAECAEAALGPQDALDGATRDGLRAEFAALEALDRANRHEALRDRADAFVTSARSAGAKSFEARGLLLTGRAYGHADPAEGADRYQRAAELADEIGLHAVAAHAWTLAALLVASRLADLERTQRLHARALASLSRIRTEALRERLSLWPIALGGQMALHAGDVEAAREAFAKASTLASVYASRSLAKIMLGQVLLERTAGNLDEAAALLEKLVRFTETDRGPQSHELVRYLDMLADTELVRGRPDAALEVMERALAIDGEAPPVAGRTADLVHTQAKIELALGRIQAARASVERVRALHGTAITADQAAKLDQLAAEIAQASGP